jgi:hypothetical protein
MKYTGKRPQIDLSIDTWADREAAWQYIVDSVFTKSDHWASENEFRIFRPDISPGLFEFPAEALQAVYLGMKIHPDNRDRMVAAMRRRTLPVKIYQLQPHRTEYTFDTVLVE